MSEYDKELQTGTDEYEKAIRPLEDEQSHTEKTKRDGKEKEDEQPTT